jgi:hypothetical protein
MTTDLTGRVKRLLLAPRAEWAAIDQERADVAGLYLRYVGPLAVFYALCTLLGWLLFGVGFLRLQPPIATLIGDTILTILIHLLMVSVFALVVDALAPAFGAQKHFDQAFKLAAYSPTASWLGGVFLIVPMLAPLAFLAGLYSLYLVFTGLPRLMRPGEGQAMIYTIVAILCAVGLFFVVSWLLISIRFM